MTTGRWMDTNHVVHVGTSGFIAAYEDIFNGDPASDVVNMKLYDRCTFIIELAAGATGTATLTVESCDDTTPTTSTAVAFTYWVCTTPDTWGEATAAAAAGFTTTAGANNAYVVEVNSSELNSTDTYVRLQMTEVVDSPVDGGIVCILSDARYDRGIPLGALT